MGLPPEGIVRPEAGAQKVQAWPSDNKGSSPHVSVDPAQQQTAGLHKAASQVDPQFPRSCYSPQVNRIRMMIYWTIEEPDSRGGKVSKPVRISTMIVVLGTIVLSLLAMILETMPELDDVPESVWRGIETGTTIVFTIEYILRLWVCDMYGLSMITWAFRGINLCDLLSVVPFYSELFVHSAMLKWLRVLRIMRLFKLSRYSQGVKIMTSALSNSLSALYILFFLIAVGIIIFASAVYFTERLNCPAFSMDGSQGLDAFLTYNLACEAHGNGAPFGSCCWYACQGLPMDDASPYSLCAYRNGPPVNNVTDIGAWEATSVHEVSFVSIPTSMWWAAVTMTTVGYGDLVPNFWVSKVVGSIAMVSGLLIIAMPFAIVGAKLGEAMTRYVDPDAEVLRIAAELKAKTKAASTASATAAGTDNELVQILQSESLAELRDDIQDSLELKRQILQMQDLRDNLWTSIEHAMAKLAYEGILSLGPDLLSVGPKDCDDDNPGDPKALCELSLFVFRQDNFIRQQAIKLTRWFLFDWLVIFAILLNSAILMMQNYYPYDPANKPWENQLQETTDTYFIIFFAFECAVKVLAQGFILSRNSYLRDGWNWIDFIVVISGLISLMVPAQGSFSFIRTIRVLRPLRTFSAMPGLRNLFNTILKSLPGLRDVVLMAAFLMVTFGILGLHLFGGVMHRHCRLTPQPIHFSSGARTNGCLGLCFDEAGSRDVQTTAIFELFCASHEKCNATYAAGGSYLLWPIDPDQGDRFCHEYKCQASGAISLLAEEHGIASGDLDAQLLAPLGIVADGDSFVTFCGSNLARDTLYAPGEANSELAGLNLDDYNDAMESENFNFGFTNYDNLGWSLLVVFQSITLEGWTDVMYMLQDASSSALGFLYFLALIIIGSFFLLNIVLAIVWDAFMDIRESSPEEEEADQDGEAVGEGMEPAKSSDGSEKQVPCLKSWLYALSGLVLRRNATDIDNLLREYHPWPFVRWARAIAAHSIFQGFIIMIITMNVVVLSMDRYPVPLGPRGVVSGFTTAFNVIFIIEFIILHFAVLPITFWSDNTLAFDGFIVLISVIEYINEYTSSGDNGGGSAVTALRAFRLLRIFKLAKKFRSMKILMKASLETLLGMRDFVLLLFLIICIFALIGQSFFGGKFMFDDDGKVVTWNSFEEFNEKCPVDGDKPGCVPRAHFDTWLWSFTTIFQILSGENWNTVMYDGMKAAGWHMFLYFWLVMLFGNFVILNLFLAYLMYQFEAEQDRLTEIENAKANSSTALGQGNSIFSRVSSVAGVVMLLKRSRSEGRGATTGGGAAGGSSGPPGAEGRGAPVQAWCSDGATPAAAGGDLVAREPRFDKVVPEETITPLHCTPSKQECEVTDVTSIDGGDLPPNDFAADQKAEETDNKNSEKIAKQVKSSMAAMTFLETVQAPAENSASSMADVPSLEFMLPTSVQKSGSWVAMRKRSCFVFSEQFPLRKLCLALVLSPRFDQIIIMLIGVSSLLMMFQNPLNNPDGWLETALFGSNVVFTFVFAAEMLIKMMAFGVFCGQEGRPGYLQSSWNVLDSFIVIISLTDTLEKLAGADSDALSFMKIFRIARMLRPLRIISRNENLKVVVKTIGASLPQLRILLVFSLLFFLIFALLGVSMFKGSFYTCQSLGEGGSLEDHEFTVGTGLTSLCIPPAASAPYGLRFVEQQPEGGCSAGMEEWQRWTEDTPICVVHCDGAHAESHPFCQNTVPWGYHIMRCSDCRDAFCPGATDEMCRSDCEARENGHESFCRDDSDAENHTKCVDECEAECACQDSCSGLVLDAAQCVEQGGRWINRHQHFDNLEQGMISLFEICTTEGWVDLMLASVDSIGPYKQPKRDENEWLGCIMFISFILLGSFFVLNLCVGVIIDNYGKEKEDQGQLMITEAQASWISFQKALYLKKQFFFQTNLQELSPTRSHLVQIVTSPSFERLIMLCIIVNTICLGMESFPSPGTTYDEFLHGMGTFFTAAFNIEFALKICAMHGNYFRENWNCFDFTCVFVSDAIWIFETFGPSSRNSSELATVISSIRIFRIARLFRLVRFLKGLNQLFYAFVLSVPKLFNVAAIMMLLIYLYAVLGINLFAKVTYPLDGSYDNNANFRTFPSAMSLLIRAMTGEGWNELMHDLSKSKFDMQSHMNIACEDNLDMALAAQLANVSSIARDDMYFFGGPTWEPTGCGTPLAFVYFSTYTVVVTFVILNLFIAVIFEGFEESSKSELADVITHCIDTWKLYDPERRMLIPVDRVFDFIDECVEGLCKLYGKNRSLNFSMESRWDPAYTGVDLGTSLLPHYNLRYIKINNLTVTPQGEVRFVVAVKAVIRRIICQGGLNSNVATRLDRVQKLKELGALEAALTTPVPGLEKELVKLRLLEEKQNHMISATLNKGLTSAAVNQERNFMHDVAAAKLQLHARGKFQDKQRGLIKGRRKKATSKTGSAKAAAGTAAAAADEQKLGESKAATGEVMDVQDVG